MVWLVREIGNAYKTLVTNPQEKIPVEINRNIWEENRDGSFMLTASSARRPRLRERFEYSASRYEAGFLTTEKNDVLFIIHKI